MQHRYPCPGMLEERSRGVGGGQWSPNSNPAYFCRFHLTLLQVTLPFLRTTGQKSSLRKTPWAQKSCSKKPWAPQVWELRANCSWALGGPEPTALPPPPPVLLISAHMASRPSLTHQLSGFLSKVKAEIQGTTGWKACLVS